MEDLKVVTGNTEQEIWPVIESDLSAGDILDYHILIRQDNAETDLYIDIDLGGGFEGGYEITQLKASLSIPHDFKFAIHDEDFIDKMGKFFGMQDVETGYPELDEHLIIKTNDEERVRLVFADEEVRQTLTLLNDFDLGIHHVHNGEIQTASLEFNINEGITDAAYLRKIYHAFYKVLTGIGA
jgi:hypothetical protein